MKNKNTPPKIQTDTLTFKGKPYETREVYLTKSIGWVTVARDTLQKVLIKDNSGGLEYVNKEAEIIDEGICYYANEWEFILTPKKLKALIYDSNDALPKKETYYSVRTVVATSEHTAIDKVQMGNFDERHPLCDKVLTKTQLLDALKEKVKSRYFLFGEQNVDIFMNEGMRNLKRHVQDGETAYTHEHKDGDDVTNLLEAMNGCFDYAELTKKEYEQINNF